MTRRLVRDGSMNESVKHRVFAEALAKLIKLLDMSDACRLIFIYHTCPEELMGDFNMIRAAIDNSRMDSVKDLFIWYEARNMRRIAGVSEVTLQPKQELDIYNGWARRMLVEASADKREPLMRDDIPF